MWQLCILGRSYVLKFMDNQIFPVLWIPRALTCIWTTCTRQEHILLSYKKLNSHFHSLIKSNSMCSWQKATIKWHSVALSLYPNWTLTYSGKQVKLPWRLRFQLRHSDQKGQCMAEITILGNAVPSVLIDFIIILRVEENTVTTRD